ncbi:MAG: recombinase RarA, partial [Sulfurimonas sp.]|nr:recombinase RarA [Sulfurimonas sp.]
SSYLAINEAIKTVQDGVLLDIPETLKQQHKDYLNPHHFNGYIKQNYLTQKLKFVELKSIGYEKKMKDWLKNITNFS